MAILGSKMAIFGSFRMWIKKFEKSKIFNAIVSIAQGSFISANKQLSILQIFMTLKVV
jgi:hypothetical protein